MRFTLTGARRAVLTASRAGRRAVIRIDIVATDAAGNRRQLTRFVHVRP